MAAKKIQIDLQVNAKKGTNDFKKSTKTMKKELKLVEKQAKVSSTSMIKNFKKVVGVIGAAYLFREFTEGLKESISLASDLEEATGKFDVVFRGVERSARAMRDTLVDSYLMSTREATNFLSTIQDTLVPMGYARGEAARLSGEVVKLAADLGSFNNIPTAQVLTSIQSALVGNHETMRKFGVVITEANLKQEAFTMGLIKQGKEMTNQQKIAARLSLMFKQTADAQGDVARTAGSFANQMKQARANVEEMQVSIGEGLLPKLNELVDTFNKWYKANKDLIDLEIDEYISKFIEKSQTLYNLVANNANTATWGVLGYALFGKKGGAIGAALGLTLDLVNDIGTSIDNIEMGNITAAVFEDLMKSPKSSDFKDRVDTLQKAISMQELWIKQQKRLIASEDTWYKKIFRGNRELKVLRENIKGAETSIESYKEEIKNITKVMSELGQETNDALGKGLSKKRMETALKVLEKQIEKTQEKLDQLADPEWYERLSNRNITEALGITDTEKELEGLLAKYDKINDKLIESATNMPDWIIQPKLLDPSVSKLSGFPLEKMEPTFGAKDSMKEQTKVWAEDYLTFQDYMNAQRLEAEATVQEQLREINIRYLELTGQDTQAAIERMRGAYTQDLSAFQDMLDQQLISQKQFEEAKLALQRNSSVEYEEIIKKDLEGLEKWAADAKKPIEIMEEAYKDLIQGLSEGLTSGLMDFIFATDQAGANFKKFAADFLHNLGKMIIQQTILNALQSYSGGAGGIFGALFGGGKAAGGSVSAGTSYVVGEKGPELFTPSGGGTITPNSMLGGNTINTTINVSVSSTGGGSEEDNKKLANDISGVLDQRFSENLQKEMRPGGLLNRSA